MEADEIKLINALFAAHSNLRIVTEIQKAPDREKFVGEFEIDTIKGTLQFSVNVDSGFPFGKLDFVLKNHRGYNHQLHYGTLCLNSPPAKTIEDRVELELQKLEIWIEKYFIREEDDNHFEYYTFHKNRKIEVVFEEDASKEPIKDSCGIFTYSKLNEYKLGEHRHDSWIAQNLGGRTNRWSSNYLETEKIHKGVWIYLEQPPVLERRQTIEKWADLLLLMGPAQTEYLYSEYNSIKSSSAYEHAFLLIVGYNIPCDNDFEVHWDLIFVIYENFPFDLHKVREGVYEPKDLGYEVDWCRTTNASYQRLFGKGKLPDKLTKSNILIVGVGAIGSSLLMALVRGGCRQIEIDDSDFIEPANVCRGSFSFKKSYSHKVLNLFSQATNISPYLELGLDLEITPVRKDNPDYKSLQARLSEFDFIFDCSTDKYLSVMLDGMELPGQILNLSISNKAAFFVVVTGQGNIHTLKSNFYDRIALGPKEPFYVATGCQFPSFQASHVDINAELMLAVKEICNRLENGRPISSFFIERNTNNLQSVTYEISYNV